MTGFWEQRFADRTPMSGKIADEAREVLDIDYVVGHGALILGHGHPATVAAVKVQVERGTHYGAAHRSEVEWARLVCDLVPRPKLALAGVIPA